MELALSEACDKLQDIYKLSPTEKDIIILISEGYSPYDIAKIRSRSIETIRTQIKQIMQKIGVNKLNAIVIQVFNLIKSD